MASKHKIEWTEQTWNPSAGCTKISSGCKNCYAEAMAVRLQALLAFSFFGGLFPPPSASGVFFSA